MEKIKCQRCLREYDSKDIILSIKNGTSVDFFCKDCNTLFGTCKTCKHNFEQCNFFSNNDPTEKFIVVQNTQRQGGLVITQQREIPNPERIRKFCLDGKCQCCNEQDKEHPFCSHFSINQGCLNYTEMIYPTIEENVL